MLVRLGGAMCVAAVIFACSSSSTSIVKSNGIARGATTARSLLARRAAKELEQKNQDVVDQDTSAAKAMMPSTARADAAHADAAIAGEAGTIATGTGATGTGAASTAATKIAAAITRALSAGATIKGVASTYNPFRAADTTAGGIETASGERYNPAAWTAAIQINLRDLFGGVRYGKDYRPCFALVAKGDKQVIIKINDVGPLEPGRVIDFNEQTMRYFDPTLELGLIGQVAVTPLVGDGWLTGPIAANN